MQSVRAVLDEVYDVMVALQSACGTAEWITLRQAHDHLGVRDVMSPEVVHALNAWSDMGVVQFDESRPACRFNPTLF